MSNLITEWRKAVQAYLEESFEGAEVKNGREIELNRREKDVILVFWPGWPELARDIAFATPTLTIRYFPTLSKQPPTTSPRDEGPLEQAAVGLMEAMATKRKAGDFVDGLACRIATCTPHSSTTDFYVESEVRAYALNLAASAA